MNQSDVQAIQGYDNDLDNLVSVLKSDLTKGLTSSEAGKRLEQYGPNAIPKPKQSFWQVYLAPLFNTLIVIYLIMTSAILVLALIYLFIDPSDTSIWFTALQWIVIVGVNFGIAIIQQQRAQKKIEALQKLSAPEARVIRNGKEAEIATDDVVPGDIIIISQGDKIPADARIIRSSSFAVNESSLTGESIPVNKVESGEKGYPEDTPIGERKNMVYNGTFATMGSGRAIVVNTGGKTEFGKISLELEQLNTGDIPIRAKVNEIGNVLALGMVIVFAILTVYRGVIVMSTLDENTNLIAIIIPELSNIIIKAMSVVPINIPLLTTIVLVTGVLAMAKHNVIIRNLASIESLGRISILCSDKTGTITAGQMTVKGVWDATENKKYFVTGLGYAPEGKIVEFDKEKLPLDREMQAETEIRIDPKSTLGYFITSGMLNNDSEIIEETSGANKVYNSTGSPTESALLALFNKSRLQKDELSKKFKIEREFPFDSSLKRMTKVYASNKKGYVAFCKGATEFVLDRCTEIGYDKNKRKLTEKDKKNILKTMEDYASQGYRVLSLTYKEFADLPPKNDKERESIETDLSYLGQVAIVDPPRDKVDDSVTETKNAGIILIMITGDSIITATAIAENIGMVERSSDQIHEGKMAKHLNDKDFASTKVFARVAPQDKQTIVERYQNQRRIVAMTGDGVNDALALSMSDAGIAMGIAGTEVSKQAADLVIADDSFNSIVTGIREGRALFQRIRVIIFFYICANLAEAALYIGASFLTNILPGFYFDLMDNLQRAYIFGILHSLPPLALIVDKIPRDIMDRDPIDTAGIFNKKLALSLLVTSVTLAVVIYFMYFLTLFGFYPVSIANQGFYIPVFQEQSTAGIIEFSLRPANWSHAKARTMMHTILYLAIPFIVLSIRRIDKSIIKSIKEDSWIVTYLFAFSVIPIHIAIMYLPFLQEIIGGLGLYVDIIGLDIFDWIVCLGVALIPLLALETAKYINRRRGQYY